jgi:hypothetical protein
MLNGSWTGFGPLVGTGGALQKEKQKEAESRCDEKES